MKNWKLSALLNIPPGTASRSTTVSRVYLIIALFVVLIFCLVLLFQVQMDSLNAIRAYVGGEGLWAKAQKDATRSLEHYVVSRDEADYQAYLRLIQVPLGDRRARIELQKENPDIAVAQAGLVQGRNHPDDLESAVRFFRRFQHIGYMSQVIEHWTTGDRMIAELNRVAEALHDEIASGRDNPEFIRSYFNRMEDINRQMTVKEDLFSSTLAEASRWANDVSRNLTYVIALLFVALGVGLAWPIIIRIRIIENSLLESEARLRSIFEHIHDIIYTIEADGTFSSISPSCERVLGWSPGELISRPFPLFVHPDDLPRIQELFMQAQAGKSLPVFQVNILMKSGGYLEAEIVANLINHGGTITILGVIRDISERRQMEQALQESEAHYRRITEGLTDFQYKVRIENGRAVETTQSPACVTVTGYTAEEFAANPDLWIQMLVPEDRERVMKQVVLILAGMDVPPIEYRLTRKNGEIRWISDTAILFRDVSGKLLSYDGVVKDITAFKQNENDEMLKVANQSRLVMLGVIEDQKRAEDALRHLNEELENKVAARTADLEHARLEAEQANQAKSAFLAAMSHEIRTPMNGVIGMLDVLKQSSLKGSQVEMVNIIHDSAFALLDIIDDILDFSKIEAGKIQVESAPMNIADVVEGACKTLDRMALKKEVELTLFTEPAIPAAVMGDAGRLRQILINLVNNAIKFSSGQGRQARVSVRALLVENTPEWLKLEFRVTDNGIGIDEETLARLFTPFTQADSATTRTYGGSGLGLDISRQLANIMGGEIAVQSELGKGSIFSVHLPFALSTEQPAADKTSSLVAGLSCLVVDGPNGIGADLAAYLAYGKAVVERAADMAAARQWIASRPVGLCIVVIDTAAANSPQDTSLLVDLRAAARAQPGLDVRFVVIGRGGRRRCRVEAPDWVALDAEVMYRREFLAAVAVAAGRAEVLAWENLHSDVKTTLMPLSREEARQRGSLILVAEDNEINQKVIQQQLKLLGQTADITNNGREALERWQSGDYSVLLTDLHMPKMDGYELTAAIRAAETVVNLADASEPNKARTTIIAYTANATKSEAEHCRAVGMDDYLSKPVQLVNLKAMLEKWLPVAAEAAPAFPPPLQGEGWGGDGLNQNNSLESHAPIPPPAPPLKGGESAAAASVPVDVSVLKALVGDDEAIIQDFLHDFRLSAAKIAAELRAACAADNAAAIVAAAHKLKSSACAVGALALGELCAEMEQAGKDGQSTKLAALLPRFEAEVTAVLKFIATE